MFWKRKKAKDTTTTTTQKEWYPGVKDPRFKPYGNLSCKQALLAAWVKIPLVFSSRNLVIQVRTLAGVNFMDTTVTSMMRKLRDEGRINYRIQDYRIGSYQKLD